MKRIAQRYLKWYHRWSQYYIGAGKLIAADNMKMLYGSSLLTVIIVLAFMVGTPLILPYWEPSAYHYIFVPVSIAFFTLMRVLKKWLVHSQGWVTFFCGVFQVMVYTFIIMMDALTGSESRAGFMPVICIAIPSLFVLRMIMNYGILFAAEVTYIILTLNLKIPYVGRYEVFTSLVGCVCSVCMSRMILGLRLRNYESQVQYHALSSKDTLSDVLNKKAMIAESGRFLKENNPEVSCALLFFDLDNFKSVNDTKGHLIGDAVLKSVADTLRENLRAEDIVGRFGGDEYIALLKNISSVSALEEKCRSLQKHLSENCTAVAGMRITLSVGGIVTYKETVDFDRLLHQADQIMYTAKAIAGKGRFLIEKYDSQSDL